MYIDPLSASSSGFRSRGGSVGYRCGVITEIRLSASARDSEFDPSEHSMKQLSRASPALSYLGATRAWPVYCHGAHRRTSNTCTVFTVLILICNHGSPEASSSGIVLHEVILGAHSTPFLKTGYVVHIVKEQLGRIISYVVKIVNTFLKVKKIEYTVYKPIK